MNHIHKMAIQVSLSRARERNELDAACTYFVIRHLKDLESMSDDEICELFGRKPSWKSELGKARAFARFLKKRGTSLNGLHEYLMENEK